MPNVFMVLLMPSKVRSRAIAALGIATMPLCFTKMSCAESSLNSRS